MSHLEDRVRTTVADLAAEAPYVTDLAPQARMRGNRIRRRRRMVLGAAVAALAGATLIPYAVLGGNAVTPPVPAASAPAPTELPPAPVIRKSWWESPVRLPGGFVVTALSRTFGRPGAQPSSTGTTLQDGSVVLDRSTGRYRVLPGSATALLAAPVGLYSAVFAADSRVGIANATTGRVRQFGYGPRSGGNGFASDAQWSPDGTRLMMARSTGIRILDADTGEHQDWNMSGFTNLRSLTWLPSGTEIAVAASDKWGTTTIRTYSVDTRKMLRTLPVHGAPVSQNAWSPDGRHVLLFTDDNRTEPRVRVAEVATGETVGTVPSAGSAYFVTADQILVIYDGTAKLYDLSGKLLQKTVLPKEFAGRQISVGRP
jgi:hypothetical protein